MQLRTELAAVVLGFAAVVLVLAFSAIGLFVRMGPAIDRILTRNDATIVAAEDILETLADSGGGAIVDAAREKAHAAIARARENVTEPGEEPVLDAIDRQLEAALAGDRDARRQLLTSVEQLIEVNRAAMREVDRDAQRLGRAGAWVAAVIGIGSLALCLLLSRSLGRRVARPMGDLRDTLAAQRGGDTFRRCSTVGASPELRDVLDGVNELLDERATLREPPAT
ncbi:MAG: hypothetical protein H6835_10080 [Planctomycetes bacterium]|nr:hypothetical protein [Planctomycetota bacterium]